jgi:predicted phosphodiesterase
MSIALRNELFENSCDSIDNLISDSKLPIVVITHHVPSYKLIDPVFTTNKYKPYNQCYFTDCEKYFKDPIKVWIYGHTHKESNTEINGIKFLCNPKGYPNENLNVTDFNRVIEL